MPTRLAEGDLDGDLYFVTWDDRSGPGPFDGDGSPACSSKHPRISRMGHKNGLRAIGVGANKKNRLQAARARRACGVGVVQADCLPARDGG